MINRRAFSKVFTAGAAAATSVPGLAAASAATPGAGRPGTTTPGVGGPVVIPPITPGTHTSLSLLKQVRAGELNIGYAEEGPADGPVVICLHGWPYDIHSFVDVAPTLAAAGYRVIVPYLRGHGTTTFLSPRAVRNAQQSAIALDIIALMDTLKIRKAVLAGFDWGSRTADIIAALWPDRVKALVSVSGYLITNLKKQKLPLKPGPEHVWWYQYYFATDRGQDGFRTYTKEFTRLVWQLVSPTWNFDDATFDRTAAAFSNPDYVPIVIHNYRWRLSLADGERRYDHLEKRLAATPTISVPTITLDAELDPFTTPDNGASYRSMFTGPYAHRTLNGIGHNVPQEAPQAFTQAVMDADNL
ncbi:alpha/beta hydrolase [Streptomyces sp. NPDC005393]|uniref:alpha/beta fold hydrolase n=1 Tax=Streptomyces sp. NPDC005393 TaxID=3157041 RepID=UPI0033BA51A7